MDDIHFLQLILQGSFKDIHVNDIKTTIHAHLNDLKLQSTDEFNTIANEMVGLIAIATMPILVVDSSVFINGQNANVAELTWFPIGEVVGRSLVKGLILEDSKKVVECVLYFALQGMVLISCAIQFISYCSHM